MVSKNKRLKLLITFLILVSILTPSIEQAGGLHFGIIDAIESKLDELKEKVREKRNNPPNTPSNPSPPDTATNQSIYADLSWTGGDPDAGDIVTYDVYFEANDSTPDVLVSDDQSATSYDPGTLGYNTHYYWKIVATDNHGASTNGPVWSFTTTRVIWNQTNNPSGEKDEARGVAVDGTGVYVAGVDGSPGNLQWRIEKRSLVDGSVIWTQTNNPSGGPDWAFGVAVDGTGVYVAGVDESPGNLQWRIEKRSLVDGSVIWTQTNNPSGDSDWARGVAVDGTGVYVVGCDGSPGNSQWRIEKRSLVDGSVIWTQTNNPSGGPDWAFGVAVDGTGVYVVGWDESPGNLQWRIEKRSLVDGSVIWTQTNNPSGGWDWACGVAVDGTGVYVVGWDESPGTDDYQWRIEKRSLTNGDLIWSKTSNPSNVLDWAFGVAVDGTGVYVVGDDGSPGNSQWRIEKRSLVDGSVIWTQTNNPSDILDSAHGVAVDGTGVYAAGKDESLGVINDQWRIEKYAK
jgi:hypothetical protein